MIIINKITSIRLNALVRKIRIILIEFKKFVKTLFYKISCYFLKIIKMLKLVYEKLPQLD